MNQIKKNFLYNIMYQILVLIIPLITVPYVSRILGADGVGIHSYTYSISCYFMMIGMLGLNNYGNRSIAKVRDDKEKLSITFCSIYSLQFIVACLMLLIYIIYILVWDISYKKIAMIQTMYVISSVFNINWFFFGLEKFKMTVTRNMIIKILSLVCILLFVNDSNDLWIYTAILSFSTLISEMALWPYIKKYVDLKRVRFVDIYKHLKPCLILFVPVIAVSVYKTMDKIMLGSLTSVIEVGYYENAVKIIDVPKCIMSALGTVMLPRMSNLLTNGNDDKGKIYIEKSLKFIMFMAFPISMGLIAVSSDFIPIFLGNDFYKTGILINYLSIALLFLTWANVIRTQYLIPKERDVDYITSVGLGAVVNLIMNIILIPKYSSVGACYGTIAAEFTVMAYQTFAVRNELDILKYIKEIIPFFIKSIIMFMCVYILKFIPINTFTRIIIQVMIGIVIYAILNLEYINSLIDIKGIKKYYKKSVS